MEIIHISMHGDYRLIAEAFLCNTVKWAKKRNGHFTFKSVIDSWDTHLIENINSGAILFFFLMWYAWVHQS